MSTTPSDADIAKVKQNLANMQVFNDYVYNGGNSYIANCFLLLSSQDTTDPGLLAGVSLMEGCMGAIFSFMGPVGAFSSCFLCSIISGWASAAPPNLNATFASELIRFDKSHVQLDLDISTYAQNPALYWDKFFSWNGVTITLGQLSTIDFPGMDNPDFYTLAQLSFDALDRSVWTETLKMLCKISHLVPYSNHSGCTEISGKTDINAWYSSFLSNHPEYYCTWSWHSDTGLFDHNYWYVNEYIIDFKDGWASNFKLIPVAACNYLFIDSTDGHVINSKGLFARKYVFNDMPLQHSIISSSGPLK